MQQTTKYKLNLIEPSDPFLPEALNANTQKVEDVLIDKMEGPVEELKQRVTVLEGHKFAFGVYDTEGRTYPTVIELGFRPRAVIVQETVSTRRVIMMTENSIRPKIDGLFLADNGIGVDSGVAGFHFFVAFA